MQIFMSLSKELALNNMFTETVMSHMRYDFISMTSMTYHIYDIISQDDDVTVAPN